MPRPDEALLALAALGVLLLGTATVLQQPDPAVATASPVVQPVEVAPVVAARPAAVGIAALGLTRSLQPLGRLADGSLEVPSDYDAVGAWTGTGPLVLAGHVDSTSGPAVFFRLGELTAGDEVTVRDAVGGVTTFVVERVEQHAKDAFPTFDVFTGDGLRLVTCGGAFDRRTRSYRDNLVVYARAA